jgi:hypothetical protein
MGMEPRMHQDLVILPMEEGAVPEPIDDLGKIGGLKDAIQRILLSRGANPRRSPEQVKIMVSQDRSDPIA